MPPVIQPPALDAENASGLHIVEALCTRCNFFHPRSGGKVVWGELPLPSGGFTPAEVPRGYPAADSRRLPEIRQPPERYHGAC